jgi:hemoglobin/transferrin/lactoferrin receptor protein
MTSCRQPAAVRPKARLIAIAISSLFAGVICISTPVMSPVHAADTASAAPKNYAIGAGKLGDVLAQFAAMSGVLLSFDPAMLDNLRSSGLQGNYTVQDGFRQLLAGSGYELESKGNGSYSLRTATPHINTGASGTTTLQTINVSAGNTPKPDDIPYTTAGSRAYMSAEQVQDNRGTSVGDFLAGIPGVLNGDNRNSGALDVNIRGMQGQGRVPVVIDGATQEQTVYRGYNGARSGSYVDPDFIGEVSVEKGASSAADASGAIGGVVRMRTLSTEDILLPGKQFGIRLRGGFNTNSTSRPPLLTQGGMMGGSFQVGSPLAVRDGGNMNRSGLFEPTGGNGSIAMAFTSDNVDLVAAIARRVNGNYFAGKHGGGQPEFVNMGTEYGYTRIGYTGLSPWKGGEEVLNTSTDNRSLLLKGNFRFGFDHGLEVSYMHFDSRFGEIMPTRLGTHTSAVGGFQSPLDNLDLKTWTMRYQWSPDNELIKLKINAYRTDMDHRATNLLTVMGITTESISYAQTVRDGVTVSNESLIKAIPGVFKLEYGGAWQRDQSGLPTGLENDKWVVNHLEFPPRTGTRIETSGFINTDWKINPQWQLTTGLRYADFETTDHNYKLNAITFWPNATYKLVRGATTQISGHGVSKNIGLTWAPQDGLQLYARYSDAVRMPSIFETLSGFSTGYLPPDLRPERAKTFELGVNKIFEDVTGNNDRLRMHFAYYDNNIDDYLTRSNVIYDKPIAFQVGGLGMINLKNARMTGIELSGDYVRGNMSTKLTWNHAITSRFCARPGTLHRQTELCSEGGFVNSYALQHVPPKNTVSLQLGYKMLDGRLNLKTQVNYYSKRFVESYVDSTSEIQPGRWQPYTLINVGARYDIDASKQIDFAIDNLTDRYYMDAINAALMPAPGRTIRMNFTVKF